VHSRDSNASNKVMAIMETFSAQAQNIEWSRCHQRQIDRHEGPTPVHFCGISSGKAISLMSEATPREFRGLLRDRFYRFLYVTRRKSSFLMLSSTSIFWRGIE
jgi:hypothetical protein